MTTTPAAPSFPLTRRTWRVLRWVMLVVILFGPIAEGAWAVNAAGRILVPSPEVHAPSDYTLRRNPAVDRILPEGRGGTHFYESLGSNAGLTFAGSAAIALSVSVSNDGWPEAVEMHERAHLVNAFLPDDVARVMSRMAPAARGEYAATNKVEHFGEMAARAWEIVSPPGEFCVDGTPAKRLEDAEIRVPGTSGFVLRYLSLLPTRPAERDADGDVDLRATAERLSAPARDEWIALWRRVDARRRPDGTFEPWAFPTIRAYLEARRSEARQSDRWIDRFAGVTLLPSLMIVKAVDR